MERTEIKVDTSAKGNNFLAFTFTGPDGRVLTKTEWQPTGPEDDVLLKKAQNQTKRIKHIMTKFMAEDQKKIDHDTDQWATYASTTQSKLDKRKNTTKRSSFFKRINPDRRICEDITKGGKNSEWCSR
mgnify:CR=1 FL=1